MTAFDPAQSPAVKQLVALPIDEVAAAYFETCASDPDRADVAALALREQARAGQLDAHAAILVAAVEVAPNLLCVGHIAKALGALGRSAQAGAAPLAAQLRDRPIADDVDYWSFDGAVWALGYLGGPDARQALEELSRETPSRASRSQSVFQGRMPAVDRERLFQKALREAGALVAKEDAGTWRARMGQLQEAPAAKAKGSQKAWMTR